eukprot:308466-Chlamydomonas_euryale.AAC.7
MVEMTGLCTITQAGRLTQANTSELNVVLAIVPLRTLCPSCCAAPLRHLLRCTVSMPPACMCARSTRVGLHPHPAGHRSRRIRALGRCPHVPQLPAPAGHGACPRQA